MSAAAIDFSDLGGKRVEAGASPDTIDFSDLGGKVVQQNSVASRPGVPRPSVEMNFANPLPTENIPVAGAIAQPFGEVAANLKYDPEFRKETAQYGSTAAGAAALGTGAGAPGALASAPGVARALLPIAKRYGIKALEGAGIGYGWHLYNELKKVFESE